MRSNAKKRKLKRSKSASSKSGLQLRRLQLKISASNRKGLLLKKLPPKLIVLSKRKSLWRKLLLLLPRSSMRKSSSAWPCKRPVYRNSLQNLMTCVKRDSISPRSRNCSQRH